MSRAIDELTGLRDDNRRALEIRPVTIEFKESGAFDASIVWSAGGCRVLAQLNGPQQARGFFHPNRRVRTGGGLDISVDVVSDGTSGGFRAQAIGQLIKQCIRSTFIADELHSAHSSVDIQVSVLEADGSLEAACINAASIACISAGFPMKDVIVACSAALTIDGEIVVDTTQSEETPRTPKMLVACLARGGMIVACDFQGRAMPPQVLDMRSAASGSARQLFQQIEPQLRAQVRRVDRMSEVNIPAASVGAAARLTAASRRSIAGDDIVLPELEQQAS